MHNLAGIFLQEEGSVEIEGNQLFGFSLIFDIAKPKYFFADNIDEYNSWVSSIRNAIGYSNLNEEYEFKVINN